MKLKKRRLTNLKQKKLTNPKQKKLTIKKKKNLNNPSPLFLPGTPAASIGEVVKVHGYQGHIRVQFRKEVEPKFKKRDWLFISYNNKPVPFFIESISSNTPGVALIKLRDIKDPQQAGELVKRKILAPAGEYPDILPPFEALSGFHVFDQNGEDLGEIVSVLETPEQILLSIDHKGREVLLPYHEDFLISMDEKKKILLMNIPEGLV